MKHEGSKVRKDYACMYMQSASVLVDHAVDLKKYNVTLLAPKISFMPGKIYMAKSILQLGRHLGKTRLQTMLSMKKGVLRMVAF